MRELLLFLLIMIDTTNGEIPTQSIADLVFLLKIAFFFINICILVSNCLV